jgi:positive regulator of sigma E activity
MTQETGINEDGFVISKIMYYLILLIIFLVIALGIFTKVFIHGPGQEPANPYHNHTESIK